MVYYDEIQNFVDDLKLEITNINYISTYIDVITGTEESILFSASFKNSINHFDLFFKFKDNKIIEFYVPYKNLHLFDIDKKEIDKNYDLSFIESLDNYFMGCSVELETKKPLDQYYSVFWNNCEYKTGTIKVPPKIENQPPTVTPTITTYEELPYSFKCYMDQYWDKSLKLTGFRIKPEGGVVEYYDKGLADQYNVSS